MSVAPKLPLPSVCRVCHTTIHAALVRAEQHAVAPSRRKAIVWFHDASLASIIRRGGSHEALPDPGYQPQRARVVGPILESVTEMTRDWKITPVIA
jgi:hypothetical protein